MRTLWRPVICYVLFVGVTISCVSQHNFDTGRTLPEGQTKLIFAYAENEVSRAGIYRLGEFPPPSPADLKAAGYPSEISLDPETSEVPSKTDLHMNYLLGIKFSPVERFELQFTADSCTPFGLGGQIGGKYQLRGDHASLFAAALRFRMEGAFSFGPTVGGSTLLSYGGYDLGVPLSVALGEYFDVHITPRINHSTVARTNYYANSEHRGEDSLWALGGSAGLSIGSKHAVMFESVFFYVPRSEDWIMSLGIALLLDSPSKKPAPSSEDCE